MTKKKNIESILTILLYFILNLYLGPVFEALNHFGIKGPSGLLAVYYLACSNDLRRKIDPQNESRGYQAGQGEN